jgi:3-oxoacyl-[acyl-carrier-protein] synthase II
MPASSDLTSGGRHRVAITGAGIITSLGVGWQANAEGFREGRIALPKISLFDASRQRVDRAGEVSMPEAFPDNLLRPRQMARVDRGAALLLHAALEAWRGAGLTPGAWKGRCVPISLGTSAGAMAVGEAYYKQATAAPATRRRQLTRISQYQIQSQALLLAEALGVAGPVSIIANACASGANSIGHAFESLSHGRAECAVAGGYDALCEMVFAGFDSLQALTTDTPRPFDAHRDGLALGEGAGVVILETFAHARARGAEILAELCGYGAATDLHHLTQPHPQGDAAVASMTAACACAGIAPRDIGYINSHGTGTPLNDVAEANAIVRWAGAETAEKIAVSSTKAGIGHLLGGAGSVETVISLMALRGGWLPPTLTIRTPDPACGFDLVRAPRQQRVDFVLTNSFGFGGANATLILGRGESVPCATAPRSARRSTDVIEIAVCGAGAVSPAGWGLPALTESLASGAALPWQKMVRAEGAPEQKCRPVPAPETAQAFLRDPRLRRVSPIARFAAAAGLEALGPDRAAALRASQRRLGIIYSIFNGCVQYSRRFYAEVLADPRTASPILFPETVFNAPASHLGALLGCREINYTLIGDTAGFLSAVQVGTDWLREDRVDGVLVIGAEELDWLSSEAAALFDPALILAEGAAAVYLERAGPEHEIILTESEGMLYTPDQPRRAAVAEIARTFGSAAQDRLLCDDLTGSSRTDAAQAAAWRSWQGLRLSPRAVLGENLGAGAGWQLAAAWHSLTTGACASALTIAAGNNEQAAACLLRRRSGGGVED